ncbi:MAG: hypothetical protein ACI8R4_002148 [Paracoccaceae bacterium]|jgi:hypothetical protein
MDDPKPNAFELIFATAALAVAGFAFYSAAVVVFVVIK